jgi:hypothetical protein
MIELSPTRARRGVNNMKDVVYVEWVPAGALIKTLAGFFLYLPYVY